MMTKTEQILSTIEKIGSIGPDDMKNEETFLDVMKILGNSQTVSDAAVDKLLTKMDEETVAEIVNSASALVSYAAVVNEGMISPIVFMIGDKRAFRYYSHSLCVLVIGMLLDEGVLS